MSKSVSVLLLSSVYDFPTDLICAGLKRKNVPYLRINKEQFENYDFVFLPQKKQLSVEVKGEKFIVSDHELTIFFRHPIFLRNVPSSPVSVEEQLQRTQWNAFSRSLQVFSGARWMNHPQAIFLAECKAFQLALAQDIGFLVPETVITNSLAKVNCKSDSVIVKPIDTIWMQKDKTRYFPYATKVMVGRGEVPKTSVPVTCQDYLEPKRDIRVTIIEHKMFAVEITKNGVPISGDWRLLKNDQLSYDDHKLPELQVTLLHKLMNNLGLKYGAVDLALTEEGYYFLEINPTGEWGWLVSESRRIDQYLINWMACDV